MRVVFLGSPSFAVPALHALVAHPAVDVALVVTQPDRPAGRGRSLTAPPVAAAALEAGIPLFQPTTLKDDVAVGRLRESHPDVLVVVAYGEILRRDVLDLCPHGAVNVHPSLLPRYRGATPIPAAILNGDITTGISFIRLVRRLDAGPIVAQYVHDIDSRDTTGSLGDRLAIYAASLLPEVLVEYVNDRIVPVLQDDALATYTREWTSADGRIDWQQPAEHIDRLVRASNPWPMAWSTIDSNRVRIIAAEVSTDSHPAHVPGYIDTSTVAPQVSTGQGWLRLVTVQPAGKRPMPASDWLRGSRLMSTTFDLT